MGMHRLLPYSHPTRESVIPAESTVKRYKITVTFALGALRHDVSTNEAVDTRLWKMTSEGFLHVHRSQNCGSISPSCSASIAATILFAVSIFSITCLI